MRSCPLRRRDRLLMDCFLPPMSCESSHFCGWMVELSSMGHSGFAVATSISDPFRHGAAHSCCQLACGLRHGLLGCRSTSHDGFVLSIPGGNGSEVELM